MPYSWDAPCCPSPGASSNQAQTVRFSVDGSSGSIPEPVWSPWPGRSGAQACPQGDAWGTEEQAQQPPKASVSYPAHEQSCLQGGAEIRVQIHEYFLLLKGVIFSISPPLYSLNHLNHGFVWVF